MIIACLGDSLTEGDYGVFGKSGIANVQKENYPYFLSKILGCEVRNFGKCGYRADSYLRYYRSGQVNLSGVDCVLVMLGTNGGHSLTQETDANLAYRELIKLIEHDAPSAAIVLLTPPHVTENPAYSNCGYADGVAAAVKFVRAFAKERGIPLIDTARCPDFTAATEAVMQPNDGLHFSKIGYQTLAAFVAKGLLEWLS